MADESPRPPDTQKNAKGSDGAGNSQNGMGLLGLGLQLAVTVAIFAAAGWWLDGRMKWSPWGLVGLSFAGLAIGLYQFVKDATR